MARVAAGCLLVSAGQARENSWSAILRPVSKQLRYSFARKHQFEAPGVDHPPPLFTALLLISNNTKIK